MGRPGRRWLLSCITGFAFAFLWLTGELSSEDVSVRCVDGTVERRRRCCGVEVAGPGSRTGLSQNPHPGRTADVLLCLFGFKSLYMMHRRFSVFFLSPDPTTSPNNLQVLRKFAFQVSWTTKEILYRLDVGWPNRPEYFTGTTFCVAIDSLSGLVYVAQRGDNIPKVLVFTEDGYFLRSWNYTVDTPHGIFAASTLHEQSVWITDVGSVLGTPGKKGTGLTPLQFDNPAELYVDDTGDIYIVDGDGGLNNRLIKLSQDFMILWLHGERGTGPAKFNIPHSVTVDSAGRVWVADRGNKRIQVFDKDTGEWLGAWNNCFTEEGPSSVRFTPDGKYVIVAQLNLSRVLLVAAPPVGSIGNCSVINTIQLADQVLPHLLDVSGKTGAVYVAEIGAKQVQKYVPVEGYFPSFTHS
ncbi:NHL repeat-containing protein 3 isoform X2 [Leopardus geoffroyi]|uniref:NHL repeat-containing protein 3 isoform X2 n=1 Tax=Leopardus geoffroyi TaxID=46844 RepID=UPI001E25FF15|nr:NHL repeat-containing protein 3 isoform X2 [Leopardus geoffroyi]